MAKAGEKSYFNAIGDVGQNFSLNKPFSCDACDFMLADLAVLFHLLPVPPASILDLGCGTGWTSHFLARRGYDVTGQDISEEALALGTKFVAGMEFAGSLRFCAGDYENIGFDREFDAAIFYDSLHHAEDEKAALACAYRALKPGGLLITHEPGEGHSLQAASIDAMATYSVTEKDMPPHHIIALGSEIGFIRPRIYPLPHNLFAVLYNPKHIKNVYRFKAKGFVRNAIQSLKMIRNIGLRSLYIPSDRSGNIVVMEK